MKRYNIIENKDIYEYVETLLFGDRVVNVFLDDYGQCYCLQYYEKESGEMVTTSCGSYETDYIGYAEMLFEDPKNCEHYKEYEHNSSISHTDHTENGEDLVRCEIDDKTYCTNCKFCFLVQDRDKREREKKGTK